MESNNHKTIFLLHHSFYISNTELKFNLPKHTNIDKISLSPIKKTLWTSVIEAVLEYARIVWDVFPKEKLIRFIISGSSIYSLNSWDQPEQDFNYLLKSVAQLASLPSLADNINDNKSIIAGLETVVEAMRECTAQQQEMKENNIQIINKCRIICITSFDTNNSNIIEDQLLENIISGNKTTSASDKLTRIDSCELIILNIHSNVFTMTSISKHKISDELESEVYHIAMTENIIYKLLSLMMSHYNLASTTVTDIPMRGKQKLRSSANYNVEIFHPKEVHENLYKSNSINMVNLMRPKLGFDYYTIPLKWALTKSNLSNIIRITLGLYHFALAESNSQPSLCLSGYVLSGHSVLLEVTKMDSTKTISNLLTVREGQLYLHSLLLEPSLLDTTPVELPCGTIKKYKIKSYGSMKKHYKLYPVENIEHQNNRSTKTVETLKPLPEYLPITMSSSIIHHYKDYMEPILTLIPKPELKDLEVIQCKKNIYSIAYNQAKQKPLTPAGLKIGVGTEEIQYTHIWAELRSFIRKHCTTQKHVCIMNCLLEVKSKDFSYVTVKDELEQSLKEFDRLILEHLNINTAVQSNCKPVIGKTIFELWIKTCEPKNTRAEFAGMSKAQMLPNGNMKFPLYGNLNAMKSFSWTKKD